MMESEEDAYCLRNRGTEHLKSPEMLAIARQVNKEMDSHDRRRKVPRTRPCRPHSAQQLTYSMGRDAHPNSRPRTEL